MKKFLILALSACAITVTGCGYTTSSALPPGLRTVHIPAFKNSISYTDSRGRDIYFPLLEVKVRNAIEDRFLFDGNLRIAEEEAADMVLTGELVSYDRSPLRYTDDDDVQEYRVQIAVDLVLTKVSTQETIWEEKGFVGETTYFITGALAKSESSAVQDATVDLARRVVERTIENW